MRNKEYKEMDSTQRAHYKDGRKTGYLHKISENPDEVAMRQFKRPAFYGTELEGR